MKKTVFGNVGEHKAVLVRRPAESRGLTDLGWLQSRHTFSFGDYLDPEHMGFHSLRVINEDIVAPGQGFGTHGHRDAEIFSYVIEGELEHKDSMGNGSIIKPGNFQYMSAGKGIQHGEFNPSTQNSVHFLQIWLLPNIRGGEPRYAERALEDQARNALTLLYSGTSREGAVQIRQDANVYFGNLNAGRALTIQQAMDRHAWIHIIRGDVRVLEERLKEGDGLGISNVFTFEITADQDSEFLLFDLL